MLDIKAVSKLSNTNKSTFTIEILYVLESLWLGDKTDIEMSQLIVLFEQIVINSINVLLWMFQQFYGTINGVTIWNTNNQSYLVIFKWNHNFETLKINVIRLFFIQLKFN